MYDTSRSPPCNISHQYILYISRNKPPCESLLVTHHFRTPTMNRNLDILWEIILSLINQPSPRSLYCFLAANPDAFSIFGVHGTYPLTRRVTSLEHDLISRLERAVSDSTVKANAADAAVVAAQAAVASAGAHEVQEVTATVMAAMDQEAAARKTTKDVRDAVIAVKPIVLKSSNSKMMVLDENNPVLDKDLRDTVQTLVHWRGFRFRLFEAAAKVPIVKPRLTAPSSIMKATKKIVADIRRRGPDEFGNMWRRRFFGLGEAGVRRSARVRRLKEKKLLAGK
ncbi:hypothetical protein BZA05DRAFT_410743 [Tricharina praecox]|uniref:uncharacterized protein n=1 Tax=Tricharina praecox TaxID=43433 RepID=UPI00222019E7|nr:uncharacterized protein BZA05DRAFT_410743 [Tricharina praecox]KAI5843606.1 hypothetical protein BZA05DRAFT_410743 [Tricharina praecox]